MLSNLKTWLQTAAETVDILLDDGSINTKVDCNTINKINESISFADNFPPTSKQKFSVPELQNHLNNNSYSNNNNNNSQSINLYKLSSLPNKTLNNNLVKNNKLYNSNIIEVDKNQTKTKSTNLINSNYLNPSPNQIDKRHSIQNTLNVGNDRVKANYNSYETSSSSFDSNKSNDTRANRGFKSDNFYENESSKQSPPPITRSNQPLAKPSHINKKENSNTNKEAQNFDEDAIASDFTIKKNPIQHLQNKRESFKNIKKKLKKFDEFANNATLPNVIELNNKSKSIANESINSNHNFSTKHKYDEDNGGNTEDEEYCDNDDNKEAILALSSLEISKTSNSNHIEPKNLNNKFSLDKNNSHSIMLECIHLNDVDVATNKISSNKQKIKVLTCCSCKQTKQENFTNKCELCIKEICDKCSLLTNIYKYDKIGILCKACSKLDLIDFKSKNDLEKALEANSSDLLINRNNNKMKNFEMNNVSPLKSNNQTNELHSAFHDPNDKSFNKKGDLILDKVEIKIDNVGDTKLDEIGEQLNFQKKPRRRLPSTPGIDCRSNLSSDQHSPYSSNLSIAAMFTDSNNQQFMNSMTSTKSRINDSCDENLKNSQVEQNPKLENVTEWLNKSFENSKLNASNQYLYVQQDKQQRSNSLIQLSENEKQQENIEPNNKNNNKYLRGPENNKIFNRKMTICTGEEIKINLTDFSDKSSNFNQLDNNEHQAKRQLSLKEDFKKIKSDTCENMNNNQSSDRIVNTQTNQLGSKFNTSNNNLVNKFKNESSFEDDVDEENSKYLNRPRSKSTWNGDQNNFNNGYFSIDNNHNKTKSNNNLNVNRIETSQSLNKSSFNPASIMLPLVRPVKQKIEIEETFSTSNERSFDLKNSTYLKSNHAQNFESKKNEKAFPNQFSQNQNVKNNFKVISPINSPTKKSGGEIQLTSVNHNAHKLDTQMNPTNESKKLSISSIDSHKDSKASNSTPMSPTLAEFRASSPYRLSSLSSTETNLTDQINNFKSTSTEKNSKIYHDNNASESNHAYGHKFSSDDTDSSIKSVENKNARTKNYDVTSYCDLTLPEYVPMSNDGVNLSKIIEDMKMAAKNEKSDKGHLYDNSFDSKYCGGSDTAPAPSSIAPYGELQIKISHNETEQQLVVDIIKARNLIAKDTNGFSDPYVKVYLLPGREQENKRRTRHINKTLNPEWNFTVYYPNVYREELTNKTLEFIVMDWDRFKSNDLIGMFRIDLSDSRYLDGKARWFTLKDYMP